MNSDSSGETVVSRVIRIVILTATIAVASSALIRPIVAFVDAPAKQLRLLNNGKTTTFSLSHEIERVSQPWQVNPNGLITIKKYTYTGPGVHSDQQPEAMSLYLQVTGSSARSSRAYAANQPESYLEIDEDYSCPHSISERESGKHPDVIDSYSHHHNPILWLMGIRPYDQKACLSTQKTN